MVGASSLSFVAMGGRSAAVGKQGAHSTEQAHFSAEDSGVRKPVPIPKAVLAILINTISVTAGSVPGLGGLPAWWR